MSSAATALRNLKYDRSALPRQAVHNSLNNRSNVLHRGYRAPCSQQQPAANGDAMSGGKNTQTLRERVSAALKRRIGKGRAVTVKQVARALYPRVTERTIENLIAANNEPRSETLNALIEFFDQSFADEIFAGRNFRVVKLCDSRAVEAAQQIADGVKALQALDGA